MSQTQKRPERNTPYSHPHFPPYLDRGHALQPAPTKRFPKRLPSTAKSQALEGERAGSANWSREEVFGRAVTKSPEVIVEVMGRYRK